MSDIRVSKKIQQSVFVATALAVAISAGMAWATPGAGSSSTLLGRSTFDEAFKVNGKHVLDDLRHLLKLSNIG